MSETKMHFGEGKAPVLKVGSKRTYLAWINGT